MAFKKINEEVLATTEKLGYEGPIGLQKELISKLKSGANVIAIGDEEAGKTEGMIIALLHKLKMKAEGDNPRLLVFVKDKTEALKLAERFEVYTKQTDLRVLTAYEERIINHQKDEIYLGADIVIGTPKRISKLYFLNGINLMELQTIVVEDAEFLTGTSFHTEIHRIAQSLNKCQYLVMAKSLTPRVEQLKGLIMENHYLVG